MDKLTIVMSNYIDVECDANTTPRQAYERGFRRAAEKCETVMRSRKAKNDALESENAKLLEILKSLMMGTNAELCAGRGESDCKECSMYHGEDGCTVVNAMELLGIDMYGEPLGIEVE